MSYSTSSSTHCSHFSSDTLRVADHAVCQKCVAQGDAWVHLRTCQTCGQVHCCDSSKNKHATQHFHTTGHPVVTSAEPGEYWAWCYEDEKLMKYSPNHKASS